MKPERKTFREWLCSKGWHWWRRHWNGGYAYGSDATHNYRVRYWYCVLRRDCGAQFTGPKERLDEHSGL